MIDALVVGDKIRLSGGYEMNPPWLAGTNGYRGTVTRFIPGQNETPAAVVKLESDIAFDGIVGDVVVLQLRNRGAEWKSSETVHVELCNFEPDSADWNLRQPGKWIESHATYEKSN